MNPKTTPELKPCPFCGGSATIGGLVPWAECTACEASGSSCTDEATAADAWNRRVDPQPTADLAWCAMDRDECTVTLAFDTEEQVNKFISGHPSRARTLVANDFDCPHSAFDNCDCYADQQGGDTNAN